MSTQRISHRAHSQFLLLLALTTLLTVGSCYPPPPVEVPVPADDDDSAGDDDDSAGDDDDSATATAAAAKSWLANVTIVDANGQQANKHIGIGESGTIVAIVDQRPENSTGVVISDYQDHVVIPGLIDSFTRLSESGSTVFAGEHVLDHLRANLAMGVTTVVDIGGPGWMFDLRDRIEAGEIRGPRILATGSLLTQENNYPCELTYRPETCTFVDTNSQANDASAVILARTPAALNLVFSSSTVLGDFTGQNMPTQSAEAVRLQARAADPRVPLNLYLSDPADMILVTAGVSPGEDDIGSLQLPFTQAWDPDYNWSTLSKVFSNSGSGIVSTIAISLLNQGQLHSTSDNSSWLAKTVPLSVQGDWDLLYADPFGATPELDDWLLDTTPSTGQWQDNLKQNLLELQTGAPDVTIVASSGAGNLFVPHGFGLHLELQLLAEFWSDTAFTSNPALNTETPQMKALKAATSQAAEVLGLGNEIGTIEVGKRADLVVLAKGLNPLEDISTTRNAVQVFLAGERFNPNNFALDASTPLDMVTQPLAGSGGACFVQQDCAGGWACDLLTHECLTACDWVGNFAACTESSYCTTADGLPFEEYCDDLYDGDLDGAVDCDDSDCVASPSCENNLSSTIPEARVTVCRERASETNCTLYASTPGADCPQSSNYPFSCVPADLDTNICVPSGVGRTHESCTPSPARPDILQDIDACEAGLFCSWHDNGTCLALCSLNSASFPNPVCGPGEVCVDYGNLRTDSGQPWYGLCSFGPPW